MAHQSPFVLSAILVQCKIKVVNSYVLLRTNANSLDKHEET